MGKFLIVVTLVVLSFIVHAKDVKDLVNIAYSNNLPKADGIISEGEYSTVYDTKRGLKIYFSSDKKNIYVGIVGNTKGWISVGFGSPRMDKSIMLLGYVKDNKFEIFEMLGKKHSHTKLKKSYIISSAGKEVDDITFVEFSYPLSGGNVNIVKQVDMIWAFGDKDKFTYHKAKGNIKLYMDF